MSEHPKPNSTAASTVAPPLPAGTRLRLRLYLPAADGAGAELMFGPGKADLMKGIRETGSIAAAGRAMGMSYKRAWLLVEELNAAFPSPVVLSARGGAGGGRASLSALGDEILERYHAVEAAAAAAAGPELAALLALQRQGTET